MNRFTLEGTAAGKALVMRGNSVQNLGATYSWTDVMTPQAKMVASVRGDTISAVGFFLDSLAADVSYLKPGGTVALRVRQNDERDYALRGDFTLDTAGNEVRLADVGLRFDTTTWRSTGTSAIRWGGRGIRGREPRAPQRSYRPHLRERAAANEGRSELRSEDHRLRGRERHRSAAERPSPDRPSEPRRADAGRLDRSEASGQDGLPGRDVQ